MKKKFLVVSFTLMIVLVLIFLFIYIFKPVQSVFTKSYNKSLFEAKIGNDLVFNNSGIAYVGRTEKEAKIESCSQIAEGYVCRFTLLIGLSEEAGKRHADITSKLEINSTPTCVERDSQGNLVRLFITNPNENCPATKEFYLDKKVDIYIDSELVDSLLISEDLKGKIITQITLTDSGSGATTQDAYNSAQENMKGLQYSLM